MKLIFTIAFVFISVCNGLAQSIPSPTPACACPAVSVSGPSDLVPIIGSATFTANISGGSQTGVTYNWTVSTGTITSGQGTPAITVTAPPQASVTATVEIGGLCRDCHHAAGVTANWATEIMDPISHKIDEFGALSPNNIKLRMDAMIVALNNETATGYIVNYGTPKQIAARVKVFDNAIAFRKFDPLRIKYVNGGQGKLKTELWICPPGASDPIHTECRVPY